MDDLPQHGYCLQFWHERTWFKVKCTYQPCLWKLETKKLNISPISSLSCPPYQTVVHYSISCENHQQHKCWQPEHLGLKQEQAGILTQTRAPASAGPSVTGLVPSRLGLAPLLTCDRSLGWHLAKTVLVNRPFNLFVSPTLTASPQTYENVPPAAWETLTQAQRSFSWK